ncbi:MAG: YidC/Oxa1 family membrane protein insertase [Clostridia bacterium]|nr:YidC/Oxa1 family membrane protein insertase [Clostridia bacterium]
MEFIYNNLAFQNYGMAIIVFTLFVKLILLPLSVKQQRSMERQQAIAPELEALKKKYAGDNKKLQEEQMNLYSKYGISPMSGCLPMLIQLPLILIIYQIVRQPLTYIVGLASNVVERLANLVKATGIKNVDEIGINAYFLDGRIEDFQKIAGSGSQLINTKFLKIFDLGLTPSWQIGAWGDQWKVYLPLLLIPFLAVGSSYLQMWITNRINNGPKKKKDSEPNPMTGLAGITKFLPLMTFVIAFLVPAGLGFYWTVSNVFNILQTILIKKLFNKKKKEGSV